MGLGSECEKDMAERLPCASRASPGEELSRKLGVRLIVGRPPDGLKPWGFGEGAR